MNFVRAKRPLLAAADIRACWCGPLALDWLDPENDRTAGAVVRGIPALFSRRRGQSESRKWAKAAFSFPEPCRVRHFVDLDQSKLVLKSDNLTRGTALGDRVSDR
jgi:hypothetical protein